MGGDPGRFEEPRRGQTGLLGHAAIINDRNKPPIADSEDDFEQSLRHSMTSGAATSHSAHAAASSPFRRNSLRANGVDVALTAGM